MPNREMGLEELYKTLPKLGKNDVILDVRGQDEFQAGHIPGAVNIPLGEVANRTQELNNYETIYIHCKRGGRAQTAFEALTQAGLTNLVCVRDAGMDAWIEKGYPVER